MHPHPWTSHPRGDSGTVDCNFAFRWVNINGASYRLKDRRLTLVKSVPVLDELKRSTGSPPYGVQIGHDGHRTRRFALLGWRGERRRNSGNELI